MQTSTRGTKKTVVKSKKKVYYVHVNRQKIQQGDSRIWTIHGSHGCTPANEVTLKVPVTTVYNPEGRQPRAKLRCIGELKHLGDHRYEIF